MFTGTNIRFDSVFYELLDHLLFDGNLSDLGLDDGPEAVLSDGDLTHSLGEDRTIAFFNHRYRSYKHFFNWMGEFFQNGDVAGVGLHNCAYPSSDDGNVTGSRIDYGSCDSPEDGHLANDVFFLGCEGFFKYRYVPYGLFFLVAYGVLVNWDVSYAFVNEWTDIRFEVMGDALWWLGIERQLSWIFGDLGLELWGESWKVGYLRGKIGILGSEIVWNRDVRILWKNVGVLGREEGKMGSGFCGLGKSLLSLEDSDESLDLCLRKLFLRWTIPGD